jgi:hypothetical protein
MVFLEKGIFLFKSKGIPNLKHINEFIGYVVEAGIYMQFMKWRVHSV